MGAAARGAVGAAACGLAALAVAGWGDAGRAGTLEGLATGVEGLEPAPGVTCRGCAAGAAARAWGAEAPLSLAGLPGISNAAWHLGQIPRLPNKKAFKFIEWPH